MAGLLGSDMDDPRTQGLLGAALAMLAASGPSPVRRSLGQIVGMGGREGLEQYGVARRQKLLDEESRRRNELTDLQLQQARQAMAEEAAAREAVLAEAKRLTTPTYPSDVTMVNADPNRRPGAMQPTLPQFNPLDAVSRGVPLRAVATLAGMQPKAGEGYTLKPGERRFGSDNRELASVPADPKEGAQSGLAKLLAERDAYPPGHPLRAIYDQKLALETSRQPPVQVSVNNGQRGFDNTLKLRGDFRSEPAYKVYSETESAYRQIKAGLGQESPAGDLAAATKFMKLLDPGSVVRESELVMAMQASGALDRLVNYADMTLKGTKLTPTQRKDFAALADKLYAESRRMYTAKRGEYESIAKDAELNVDHIVGPMPGDLLGGTSKQRYRFNPQTGRLE